ncbi:Conserved mid region of cactin [Fragilaria crotonensis]|nr:Conserved mid region of cactin [Fragilaria crotonensis]
MGRSDDGSGIIGRKVKHKESNRLDDDDVESEEHHRSNRNKKKKRNDYESEDSSRDRRKKKKSKKKRHKRSRRDASSSESEDSDDGDEKEKLINERLMKKLASRGETLEEREERRSLRRAARITAKFGYTPDDNPFNDPHLHEPFSWKKKLEKTSDKIPRQGLQTQTFEEIEKVRKRRQDREMQFEEMERIRAEESRMKELENYDEWARKEEEFHLQQQRQRSAIRLVEGREKPIDVLAKNLLMFGLSDEERKNRAAVKYQERYNALNELESLEAELEKPHEMLKVLKLDELEELVVDINTFRKLELEGGLSGRDSTVLRYWDNLYCVVQDEIDYLKDGGAKGPHSQTIMEIRKLFAGQSGEDLAKTRSDFLEKIRKTSHAAAFDPSLKGNADYWKTALDQLNVHLAKMELSDLHNRMLVRQLEKLEKKKVEMEAADARGETSETVDDSDAEKVVVPKNVTPGFGDLEEELGLQDEIDMGGATYGWQDKWLPRKPRYFHRVKSGYDWNGYNRTHYDTDNPPPKIVQGYRFNVFYPDLIDKTKTPQYFLEKADSDEYCIIRFSAGPPYEDIAFKIINREWNRSRKHGFCSKFERGVLTLYFSFATHWYRR